MNTKFKDQIHNLKKITPNFIYTVKGTISSDELFEFLKELFKSIAPNYVLPMNHHSNYSYENLEGDAFLRVEDSIGGTYGDGFVHSYYIFSKGQLVINSEAGVDYSYQSQYIKIYFEDDAKCKEICAVVEKLILQFQFQRLFPNPTEQ